MATVRPHALPRVTSADSNDAIILDRSSDSPRSILLTHAIDSYIPKASQAQAEAVSNDTTRMTPLLTGYAIAAQLPSTTFGKSLLSSVDASAARTALALGNSSTRNVGTAAGTVAAGDDSRVVSALQKTGDTMTGALTLFEDANADLKPVTFRQFKNAGIPFSSLLPSSFNVATDDATGYIHTAAALSATTGATIVFDGRNYKIKTPCHISSAGGVHNGFKFHTNGTSFTIDDVPGMSQTLFGSFAGRMGFRVTATDGRWTGHVNLIGTGTLGTTTLAGIVFYNAHRMQMTAMLSCVNISAGRFALWSDNAYFGNIYGQDIWGQQTFGAGTQGDLCISIGCKHSYFGDVIGNSVNKAARYCSLALDASSVAISNLNCQYGKVLAVGRSGSTESSALSIRNAEGCSFGTVNSTECVIGVNLQQYNSDTGFVVDGNRIEGVSAKNCNGASGSAFRAIGDTTKEIGENYIGFVYGKTIGGYGVYTLRAARTIIGHAEIDDANALFYFGVGRTEGESIIGRNIVSTSFYDDGATFRIKSVRCLTGLDSAVVMIQKLGTVANTGQIDELEFAQNGIGFATTMMLLDDVSSARQVRVMNTIGGTDTTSLRYGASNLFKARAGDYYKSILLTTQASIAAGAAKTQTLSWSGLIQGDRMKVQILGADPGGFITTGECYTDGTFTAICRNVSGATATWPDRNATLWVTLQ